MKEYEEIWREYERIWRNMKKIWRNMKKMWWKFDENMTKYEWYMKKYEKICGKYEESIENKDSPYLYGPWDVEKFQARLLLYGPGEGGGVQSIAPKWCWNDSLAGFVSVRSIKKKIYIYIYIHIHIRTMDFCASLVLHISNLVNEREEKLNSTKMIRGDQLCE